MYANDLLLVDSWICKMFIIFTLFTGYLPKSIYRYVMVPTGYMPTAPPFFAKLQHAVTMAATHPILAF